MRLGTITKITLAVLLCLQQLPLRAEDAAITAELQAELDVMVDDELIIKYRPKTALKNKLVHKYKASRLAAVEIHRELNREVLTSIASHYNLPVDESAPENDGYSRLSSSNVYQGSHSPLARRLKVTNRDGSSTAVLKLRKKVSKVKLHRMISKINAEKLKTSEYEVVAVYPNYLFEINTTPDDTYYKSQDGLAQINIEKAWDKSQGEGVVVAVIDTGVNYKHPDLINNIWQNADEIPGNGKDDDNNGYIDDVRGWDFVKRAGSSCIDNEDCGVRDNDPSDYNGHGTHVAGIIAAEQDNNFGISGVAPKAKIMPLRAAYSVGYSAYLKSSDVAEAVEYAIRNGADVINMSFAGSRLGVLKDVVDRANDLGVVMVAAAGNSGSSTPAYPAALDYVIAVGSVDAAGNRSKFSNYGDWVDIAAPGSNILSTSFSNTFTRKTGTSMSAPMVAGVAALVMSKSKELHLRPDQVRQRILNSSSSQSLVVASAGTAQLNADIDYPLQVDTMEFPRIAGHNQKVHFEGAGSDGDSAASSYEWSSDLDGLLSREAEFDLDDLSPGNHKISFRVRGRSGSWSQAVSKDITIDEQARLFTQSQDDIRARIVRRDGQLTAAIPESSRHYIEEYFWTSSKDGDFSTARSVPIEKLSLGLHRITLVVHDKRGFFSAPIERVIEIKS